MGFRKIISFFALSTVLFSIFYSVPTDQAHGEQTSKISSSLTSVSNYMVDSKNKSKSYKNLSYPKIKSKTYFSYYRFPKMILNSNEVLTKISVNLEFTQKIKKGNEKISIGLISSGWKEKFSYKNKPKVGSTIGTMKTIKNRKTFSVVLDANKISSYLKNDGELKLFISSSDRKNVLKLTKKLTFNFEKTVTSPCPPSIPSSKKVFGMYFPPYPLSLDNLPEDKDYYTRNYLVASGEKGKWASVGGLLRDRPIPRSPLMGDYQYEDMVTEVNEARNYGLNGFLANILTLDQSDRNFVLIEKLMQASENIDPNFKIVLMPDNTATPNASPEEMAQAVAKLAQYSSVYKNENGDIVLAPFYAEGETVDYYKNLISVLKNKYNISVSIMPLFLNASFENMKKYNDVSYAFANWGIRDAMVANDSSRWPNFSDWAHSLGKQWMEPISVQDERPNQKVYNEASNTETLRATWNRAITQNANMVLLTTWNDYSEGTSFAPSVDHGYSFLTLNKYFIDRFQTGNYPSSLGDKIIISHRIQKVSTIPSSYSGIMKKYQFSISPDRDSIEVLTLLDSPGEIRFTINGKNYYYSVPAGIYSKLFNLEEGFSAATLIRSGKEIKSVSTKDEVKFTTEQQDLSYHAVISN